MRRLRTPVITGLTALALVLSSCRTLPLPPHPPIMNWLPPESGMLVRLSIPGNEELVRMLLPHTGMESADGLIKRTSLVVLGVEKGEGRAAPLIHLALIGAWPRGILGTALGREWEKTRSYAWSGPEGWELLAPSGKELILSQGRSEVMLDRRIAGRENPEWRKTAGIQDGAAMMVWVADSGLILEFIPLLSGVAMGAPPPLSAMGLALYRLEDGSYAAVVDLYPTEERLTAPLMLALRVGLSARFGLSPHPDERALLSTLSIDPEPGKIRLSFPALSPEILRRLSGELKLPAEGEQ